MNDLAKIRTDVIGSLLRPASLKDARAHFDDGKISGDELRADFAVIEVRKIGRAHV